MQNNRVSLKDIANSVGVSVSTVSRVLNDKPSSAGAEVRDKILLAAIESGYQPNRAAIQLRSGDVENEKQLRAAVVLARINSLDDDPFFLELFREVERELYNARVTLTGVVKASDSPEADLTSADGVIILGRCSQTLLDTLRLSTGNIVGLWRNPMNFEVDEVVCDGEKAAAVAVEHLIKLGHKTIAYIGDCSFERRYIGYSETLIKHALPINYRAIIHCEQTTASGYEAMKKLMSLGEATGLLTANDAIAVGCLKAMREARFKDISVISIDDTDMAQTTVPMLTAVRIPRRDMAHMAVTLLIDRIKKGHVENMRVELPCRVISRESCRAITRP